MQPVHNWKSEGKKATTEPKQYFDSLEKLLSVPGTEIQIDRNSDNRYRSANFHVVYPGKHLSMSLASVLRPFVLLEVGNARVSPYVKCNLTSFVHRFLHNNQIKDFDDNRPIDLRCVHPMVTLLEKIDALNRRVPREELEPATFVRHFENAAWIIRAMGTLPPLPDDYPTVRTLSEEMLDHRQIKEIPFSKSKALIPVESDRWRDIHRAFHAIEPMFWGPRLSLEDACHEIRQWIANEFLL